MRPQKSDTLFCFFFYFLNQRNSEHLSWNTVVAIVSECMKEEINKQTNKEVMKIEEEAEKSRNDINTKVACT